MARISSKPDSEYPWWVRILFRLQRRKYGQVLEPAKIWARAPRLFFNVALLYASLDRKSSPIDPVLRALIMVRVSQINWCPFCVDVNAATVLKRGATEEKLRDLEHFRESPHFATAERIALEYAELITLSDRRVTEEFFERLRAYFDDDALVELTGLIAFQNLSSKFNAALDVKPQGFCRVMPLAGEAE